MFIKDPDPNTFICNICQLSGKSITCRYIDSAIVEKRHLLPIDVIAGGEVAVENKLRYVGDIP